MPNSKPTLHINRILKGPTVNSLKNRNLKKKKNLGLFWTSNIILQLLIH